MEQSNKATLLLLGCTALTGYNAQTRPLEGRRPNILIAIADDVSYPHMGAYGCSWIKTPTFDRVAKQGILFNNCYTPNAKSAPSRACLLTGLNSWQLEEAGNHIGFWPENKYTTFIESLAENGYYVAFTGKGWAPGNPGKLNGKPRQLTGIPYQENRTTPPTSGINANDYATNFEEFLQNKPNEKPWVFWYGCTEPHRVYAYGSGVKLGGKKLSEIDRVPDFWPDNDTVRNDMLDYAFEVEYFDKHLGRMIEMLERTGQLDNTIILVTADNGMPFPRCKGLQYEYSNHMPLAVMWRDGIIQPGRNEDDYISFIDFAPTFLRLAGVDPAAAGMSPSGREMTDILAKKKEHDRSFILLGQERHDYGRPLNQGYPIRSIIEDGYLYVHNFKPDLWPVGDPVTGYLNTDGSPTKTTILNHFRREQYSRFWNISFGKHPGEELYQIEKDKECLHNLAQEPQYSALKEKMKAKLFETLRSQKDPRITGNGDIFDHYPFKDQSSSYFYERFMEGKITKYQTNWVNPTDYETKKIVPTR